MVFDVFDGQRYHGEVTEVIYHGVHAQYIYRVVFSDHDRCDYWKLDTRVRDGKVQMC